MILFKSFLATVNITQGQDWIFCPLMPLIQNGSKCDFLQSLQFLSYFEVILKSAKIQIQCVPTCFSENLKSTRNWRN